MNDDERGGPIDEAAWAACLRVLRAAIEGPARLPDRELLERLAARIYKRARKQRRKEGAVDRRAHDRAAIEEVLVAREQGRAFEDAVAREQGRALDPHGEDAEAEDEDEREGDDGEREGDDGEREGDGGEREGDDGEREGDARGSDAATTVRLQAGARRCYVCRALYRDLHVRYHLLCPACAALHEAKRAERLDLRGRRALVTGARVKIGHATALRLLRDGAEVIATSRFPDAARRAFERAEGFEALSGRLQVVAADFRDPREAERLAAHVIERFGALDILVNNAAQTVARPEDDRLAAAGAENPAEDTRERNSWNMRLADVTASELLDVLHVNAAAPILLTARLLPALRASRFPDRYVVNVVGLDGQLGRPMKLPLHPHVNASKAALNMLTRTSAEELSQDGIYMSSVDVGWVTHEGSFSGRKRARAGGFLPPLDVDDAAARICDPIARGLAGAPVLGRLWKDFHEAPW